MTGTESTNGFTAAAVLQRVGRTAPEKIFKGGSTPSKVFINPKPCRRHQTRPHRRPNKFRIIEGFNNHLSRCQVARWYSRAPVFLTEPSGSNFAAEEDLQLATSPCCFLGSEENTIQKKEHVLSCWCAKIHSPCPRDHQPFKPYALDRYWTRFPPQTRFLDRLFR